jgi:hypothetical protein
MVTAHNLIIVHENQVQHVVLTLVVVQMQAIYVAQMIQPIVVQVNIQYVVVPEKVVATEKFPYVVQLIVVHLGHTVVVINVVVEMHPQVVADKLLRIPKVNQYQK